MVIIKIYCGIIGVIVLLMLTRMGNVPVDKD